MQSYNDFSQGNVLFLSRVLALVMSYPKGIHLAFGIWEVNMAREQDLAAEEYPPDASSAKLPCKVTSGKSRGPWLPKLIVTVTPVKTVWLLISCLWLTKPFLTRLSLLPFPIPSFRWLGHRQSHTISQYVKPLTYYEGHGQHTTKGREVVMTAYIPHVTKCFCLLFHIWTSSEPTKVGRNYDFYFTHVI